MIQQHGYEEAIEMIDSGKVEETEDSDGDVVYKRKTKTKVEKDVSSTVVETKRIWGSCIFKMSK